MLFIYSKLIFIYEEFIFIKARFSNAFSKSQSAPVPTKLPFSKVDPFSH